MASYGQLHHKNSQHRLNILLSPKNSYSRTSSQHRVQTLSYSRTLLNSTSSTQLNRSQSGNLRVNDVSNDYAIVYSESTGCGPMIPESGTESTEVLHSADQKQTAHSAYLKQNERLLRQIAEDGKKLRGRSSSTESERSQFEQMHARFGKWPNHTSEDESEEDQCVRVSRSRGRKYYSKPLSRFRDYDTSGTEEERGANMSERDFRFPNVPANLNDPNEFQKLMAYTSTVLGEPCYNLDPKLSISESPTPVGSSPSVNSDLSEVHNASGTRPKNSDNYKSFYEQREESQWWYSHAPKSSPDEAREQTQEVPRRAFEPYIGASFVHQSRARMRGMFNILSKINSRGSISEIPSSHLALPLVETKPSVTMYVSKALAGHLKQNENETANCSVIPVDEEKPSQMQDDTFVPKMSSTNSTDLRPLDSKHSDFKVEICGNRSDMVVDKNGSTNSIASSCRSGTGESAGEIFTSYGSPEYMAFYKNANVDFEVKLVNSTDQDEDVPSAEAMNENETQDISYTGHLAPGGFQKAEVNLVDNQDVVAPSSNVTVQNEEPIAQGAADEAPLVDDDTENTEEVNRTQNSNARSESTNAGSNENQENTQQSGSEPAPTSDAQTNIPSTASSKKRLTKKKLLKSRKSVSRTSSQSRASSKGTNSDGSENEATSSKSKSRLSRHKLSSPHVIPRLRKKSQSKVERGRVLGGQKPTAGTSAAAVAGSSNIGSQTENPSTLKSGLPRPKPTLYHGTKIGQPKTNKSMRHVSIKLPTPSESVDSQRQANGPTSQNSESGPSVRPLNSEEPAPAQNAPGIEVKAGPSSVIQEKGRNMPGPSRMPMPIPTPKIKIPFGGKGKEVINKNTTLLLRPSQLKTTPNSLKAKAQTGYLGLLVDRQKREQEKREREHRLVPMNLEFEMPLHGNLRDRILSPPRNVSRISAVPSSRVNTTGTMTGPRPPVRRNLSRPRKPPTTGPTSEGNSSGKGNL